jgi:ribonuclease HI
MSYLLRFDGASRGNPGEGGSSAVIYKNNEIIDKCYYYHPKPVTNNVAEYYGLLGGLNMCIEKGYDNIFVEGDSKLVIEQVFGKWNCSHKNMIPLNNQIKKIKKQFISIYGKWIPREENGDADEYSNVAINKKNSIGEKWFYIDNNININNKSKQKSITEFFNVNINENKSNDFIPKQKNTLMNYFTVIKNTKKSNSI